MLSFYTDADLLRPVTPAMPKLFCCPEEGGTRTSRMYLGNGYTALVNGAVAPGANVLPLNQTVEFLDAGGILSVPGQQAMVAYTGKTVDSLTGVSGLTVALANLASVRPNLSYIVQGNLKVRLGGVDVPEISNHVALSLKRADQATYGFRGTPVIYSESSFTTLTPLEIDISVTIVPGAPTLFENFELVFSGYAERDTAGIITLTPTDQTSSITAPFEVTRGNLGLTLMQRLFPANRKVSANLPGLTTGKYRWRDKTTVNAVSILPTNWNVDIASIPASSFVSGVADMTDLTPLGVEEAENSLYLRIKNGFYYEGKVRSYLPAGALLEIVQISDANDQTIKLQNSPDNMTPVYVGNWIATQSGQFVAGEQYRYTGHKFDGAKPDKQFTLQRSTGTIKLHGSMQDQTVFLGVVSGQPVDFFDIPVFPVGSVSQVYVNRGIAVGKLVAPQFTFDSVKGTLEVPSVAGAVPGQLIFALCKPGVAVLYAQGANWSASTSYRVDTVVTIKDFLFRTPNGGVSGSVVPDVVLVPDITTFDNGIQWVCEGAINTVRADADLNPAFSGITQGYLYLTQAYKGAFTISLSCDKPRIQLPPSVIGEPGLIAFGPVYYDGDYALLIATVKDSNGNPIPNVMLEFKPIAPFQGTVNYQQPSSVTVRTGGDGVANLIYSPPVDFGYYLPVAGTTSTTTVAGDTVRLSIPIPLGQLWNAREGWLSTFYQILADNPYFGIVGADTSAGQIEFTTTGTPGTAGYKTNGRRLPLLAAGSVTALLPIAALNAAGTPISLLDANADTAVAKLIFPVGVTGGAQVKAYFLAYIERVMMYLSASGSNVVSNSIMLQMAPPPVFGDTTPYLILDSTAPLPMLGPDGSVVTEGMLNVQRLAYVGADLYFQGTALV